MHGPTHDPAPTASAPEAEDADLLARLRARDERAFDGLVRAWSPAMLRVARGFVSTDASAQEVVQEAWLGVIRGLDSFEGRASLRTWAFRIAWNAALTLRSDAWHRKGRRFETGEASALAEEIRTKTVVRVERQRDALDKIRMSLTPDEQSLLALRLDREFSWDEIAEILSAGGEPVQPLTLMKRFERLKKRLAEIVRQQHEAEDGAHS